MQIEELGAAAEATLHFNPGDEVLRTETAAIPRSLQAQRAAGTDRVAKLPGISACEVFGSDRVLRQVPAVEGFGQPSRSQSSCNLVASTSRLKVLPEGVRLYTVPAKEFFVV